ncbi:MAG: adenylate kinase [Actinomycetia bacterium]|nr:adenylate kinase [Actinomycetes bacterium]
MGRRILFLGPPGGGKGTQAKLLTKALGIPHISSGEMLREAIASETELGRKASEFMAVGDLVPDDLVVAMVKERLCRDDALCGYILDGFPRNVDQAEALANAMGSDGIETTIVLHVDEDQTVERLLRRADLEGRTDDNEATIRHRLEVFRQETEPLIAYYGDNVRRVDGVGSIEGIFCRVVSELAS